MASGPIGFALARRGRASPRPGDEAFEITLLIECKVAAMVTPPFSRRRGRRTSTRREAADVHASAGSGRDRKARRPFSDEDRADEAITIEDEFLVVTHARIGIDDPPRRLSAREVSGGKHVHP